LDANFEVLLPGEVIIIKNNILTSVEVILFSISILASTWTDISHFIRYLYTDFMNRSILFDLFDLWSHFGYGEYTDFTN